MEQALVNWDAKDEGQKTWKNAKAYFTKEYANRNKHAAIEASEAGYGNSSANQIMDAQREADDAEIAAEVLAQLRANDSNTMQKMFEQQQAMLENNQKTMMQLMQALVASNNNTNQVPNRTNWNQNGGANNQNGGNNNNQTGNRGNRDGDGGGGASRTKYPEWQTTKKGDKMERNGRPWWWCPNHNEGKGLYVRHKPANHSAWVAAQGKGGYSDNE